MRGRIRVWTVIGTVMSMGLLAASAGCGSVSQNLTSPSPQAAAGVGNLTSPEVPIFNVDVADTSSDGRGPCLFDHGNMRFGCANLSQGALTLTRTVTFYDATGAVQPSFDRNTTASIKTETSVTGTGSRNGSTVSVNRSGVMVVSGLAGNETSRTFNGTETGTLQATKTDNGTTVTVNTSINDVTTDLVVPVPRAAVRRFPLSGTRSHATTVTTTRGGNTNTDTTTRVETFDGTAIVQVVLTINGVTQNCTFNLANKRSTCRR